LFVELRRWYRLIVATRDVHLSHLPEAGDLRVRAYADDGGRAQSNGVSGSSSQPPSALIKSLWKAHSLATKHFAAAWSSENASPGQGQAAARFFRAARE